MYNYVSLFTTFNFSESNFSQKAVSGLFERSIYYFRFSGCELKLRGFKNRYEHTSVRQRYTGWFPIALGQICTT
jgi:hypothetical protein